MYNASPEKPFSLVYRYDHSLMFYNACMTESTMPDCGTMWNEIMAPNCWEEGQFQYSHDWSLDPHKVTHKRVTDAKHISCMVCPKGSTTTVFAGTLSWMLECPRWSPGIGLKLSSYCWHTVGWFCLQDTAHDHLVQNELMTRRDKHQANIHTCAATSQHENQNVVLMRFASIRDFTWNVTMCLPNISDLSMKLSCN